MSLKFFADHCISGYIINTLRNAGHEVFILKEQIDKESSDSEVIATAQKLGAILVSLNGDFSDIVKYPPSNYLGIIGLQIRNHPEMIPRIMDRMKAYLSENPQMDHYKGKLFRFEVHRIRIY